jgi:hypothetical protein
VTWNTLAKLDWMRTERIWPKGLRYLWTDAFGVVLYVSLYRETGGERWPPFYSEGEPKAGKMTDAANLGTVEHDGKTMVTYYCWPLIILSTTRFRATPRATTSRSSAPNGTW